MAVVYSSETCPHGTHYLCDDNPWLQSWHEELNTVGRFYGFKQQVWRVFRRRVDAAVTAQFPDAGGDNIYFHNWYLCNRDPEIRARAEALRRRWWRRYYRIEEMIIRRQKAAVHEHHVQRDEIGRYGWCNHCQEVSA